MDTYPLAALPPRDVEWSPIAQTRGGGQSLSGLAQLTRLDGGGFWMCRYIQVPTPTPSAIEAHAALEARLDGGAAPIIVPRPITPKRMEDATFSDGATFADRSDFTAPSCIVTAAEAAALRATTLRVTVSAGELGAYFTIEHPTMGPRYYAIGRRALVSGTTYDLTIRTPLREAVSAGEALDFDTPRCVMRLADPESMKLKLDFNRWGFFSPLFVEHLFPLT